MRLIDADKLKEKMFTIEAWEYAPIDLHLIAVGDIDEAPTVDPVKHGRWKYNIILGWCSVGTEATADYVCSVCGWHTKMPTNYCPNCGAKMDEEADHDDHL